MAESLQDFTTTPGFVVAGRTPETAELYATPDQLLKIYGCSVTEGQVRFAMSIIHQVVCRASLWIEEYEQRLSVPDDRMQVILAARPVVRIIGAAGRYSVGRRDRLSLNQINLDAEASTLVSGSPPAWHEIDTNNIDVNRATGEIWLPSGILLVNYNEVMLKYTSGFAQMPDRIIAALINIVNDVSAKGSSDRTFYSVGKVQRTFSKGGFVSQTTYDLLEPFVVRSLF